MLKHFLGAVLLALATGASAQFQFQSDPDWREDEAPAPPALRTERLIELDFGRAGAMRFGIDPQSVTVGNDGVVRYVVIARGPSGTVNASYEGIRCGPAEVKVYARHNPDSGWVPARQAEWRPLHETQNSRHSLYIARNGACIGQGPNGPASKIVRDLGLPPDQKFRDR